MEPVRLAVLGAGLIGAKHAAMIAADETCALVGLGDPDPARAGVAADLGVPFYPNVEQLLDRAHPEGVIIATPNATYAAIAVTCAERGREVPQLT